MFVVYLNEKRDRLLVIARGQPIPVIENTGRWRKKKGAVAVSAEINSGCRRPTFNDARIAIFGFADLPDFVTFLAR
jgi:hypothetical protein